MRGVVVAIVGLYALVVLAAPASAGLEIGSSPGCGLFVRAHGTLPGVDLPAGLESPVGAAFDVQACEDGAVVPDLLLVGGCEAEPDLDLPVPLQAAVCLPETEASIQVCTDVGICLDVV